MANNRKGARAAVVAWFAPGAVTNLNTVFKYYRYSSPEGAFFAGQGTDALTGAIAAVNIARDHETRISMGGPTSGKKEVTYEIELHVQMRSRRDEDGIADDLDDLVEAIKARIRFDRSLGTGSARGAGDGDVWEAGERLLEGEYGDPTSVANGYWEVPMLIRFDLVQQLTT